MPEEIEVDTDKLRETTAEAAEREGSRLLRAVALTTALLAAVAAIAALEAGGTVNEALVLKTEAARLQSEASDQWAYYQAKAVKAAVADARAAPWRALGKAPPPELAADERRFGTEQQEIEAKARGLERERDAKSAEADGLLARHHVFADAVACLQVAIALGAVAALTSARLAWLGSTVLGAVGVVLFLVGLLRR
jgi:hypothetical protein